MHEGAAFCQKCGTKLKDDVNTQQATVEPASTVLPEPPTPSQQVPVSESAVLPQPTKVEKDKSIFKKLYSVVAIILALYSAYYFWDIFSFMYNPVRYLEKHAPAIVNQIITENELSKSKCTKVEITETISNMRYKGKAYIGDNHSVEINIIITSLSRFNFAWEVEIPMAGIQFLRID